MHCDALLKFKCNYETEVCLHILSSLMNVVRPLSLFGKPRSVLYCSCNCCIFLAYPCQLSPLPSSQLWITISGTSLPWQLLVGFLPNNVMLNLSWNCLASHVAAGFLASIFVLWFSCFLNSYIASSKLKWLVPGLQSIQRVSVLVILPVYTGSRLKSFEEKIILLSFSLLHSNRFMFFFKCIVDWMTLNNGVWGQ